MHIESVADKVRDGRLSGLVVDMVVVDVWVLERVDDFCRFGQAFERMAWRNVNNARYLEGDTYYETSLGIPEARLMNTKIL